jgi:hypothetical protein
MSDDTEWLLAKYERSAEQDRKLIKLLEEQVADSEATEELQERQIVVQKNMLLTLSSAMLKLLETNNITLDESELTLVQAFRETIDKMSK